MQQYTLAQIELFAEATAEQERDQLRQMAIAARSANAKQQDFEKMMRKLDG